MRGCAFTLAFGQGDSIDTMLAMPGAQVVPMPVAARGLPIVWA